MSTPKVLFGDQATARLKRGFDTLTNLLAATLGPTQGAILSQRDVRAEPEILSDAATIARRVLALPARAENVGAMLARNLVWRMHVRVGDGCATAAVLAQAILDESHRFVAAGGNAMMVKRGIDRAAGAAIDALRAMARPVQGNDDLAKVAETLTGDPKLSARLGEIFDKLGPEAHVTIEDYLAPYLECQYYEGGRWNGRLASPYLISDSVTRRAIITDCHVALFAGAVTSVEDVQALLKVVAGTQWRQVALIAKEISGAALATCVLNHRQGNLKILTAELREGESKRQKDFDDLAVLTGARVLSPEMGHAFHRVEPSDLGAAPRVEADADELIVVGGEGDRAAIDQRIATLRARIKTLPEGDEELNDLRFRLARLAGQIAKLMIGAHTEAERAVIRQKAEKAIRALPLAQREGVVPGGGVAYLDCIPAVLPLEASGDEAHGKQIIARALEAPFQRLLMNAGVAAPAAIRAEAQQRGAGFGYDVMAERIVSMEEARILDAAGVLRHALETAVSGAMMALTTEVLVLKRSPETSMEP